MDDLIELNRQLVRVEIGQIGSAVEEFLAMVPICLGRMGLDAKALASCLKEPRSSQPNPLSIVAANRAYLEHARLAAKDIQSGRHSRLVEMGFDWDHVTFMSALGNHEIRHLSEFWRGPVYRFWKRGLQLGAELPKLLARQYAAVGMCYEPPAKGNPKRDNAPGDSCRTGNCPAIPAGASLSDHLWNGPLQELARMMVEEGAKAKIIERYTNLPHAAVTAMYRSIRNVAPPPGQVAIGKPEFYTTANGSNHHSGPAWNMQGAIFLSCYEHLLRIAPYPVNRGWLLLHAYRAYLERTSALHAKTAATRLNINHCYSLLTHTGLGAAEEYADVTRHRCGTCEVHYLIVTSKEVDSQRCPICMMASTNAGERVIKTPAARESTA